MLRFLFIFTTIFSSMLLSQASLTPCDILHDAVKTNNYSLAWRTMADTGIRAHCQDKDGNSAIHVYARYGTDTMMLALLVYRGFGILDDPNHAGKKPLDIAREYQNRKSLLNIIGLSSPVNPVTIPADILR